MQGLEIEAKPNTPLMRSSSKVSLDSLVVRSAICLLLILPALVCFAYIYSFGVNVPFLDEWFFLGYYKDWQLHQTNLFTILSVQHNEHRLGVAYLIELALAQMTHCNSVAQMFLFLGCRVVTAVLLIDLLIATHGRGRWSLLLGLPIVLQLLSIRQWENLLWGFQPCVGLSCMFSILVIWLLCKLPLTRGRVIAAASAAFLSTFSFASGLITWPIGFLILVCKNETGKEMFPKKILLWSSLACLAFVLYFLTYHRVIHPIQTESENAPPLARLCFFVACLGNSIGVTRHDCFIAGLMTIILIALSAVPLIKIKSRQFFEVGSGVALYGVACVALISLGRCGEHWDRVTISRYSSLTCFVLVGLYLLSLRRQSVRPFMAATIAIMILFGYTRSIITYWSTGEVFRDYHRNGVQIMLNWDLMHPLARLKFFETPKDIESLLSFLRERRLSAFAQAADGQQLMPTDRKPFISYSVVSTLTNSDRNLHFSLKSPAKFLAAGWALEPETLKPLKAIDIIIDDKYSFPAVTGQPCPEAKKESALRDSVNCGFLALLSPGEFVCGIHTVRLKAYYNNGKDYWESTPIATLSVD